MDNTVEKKNSSSVNYEPLTPLNFLRRTSFVYQDKTAVVYGDHHYTWKEFSNRVNRLSNSLKNRGIKKGDKVGFLCQNLPPLLEAHFGIPMTGAVLVPINTRLAKREISTIIKHSEAKILFIDAALAEQIEPQDIPGIQLFINITDEKDNSEPKYNLPGIGYEDFLAEGKDEYIKYDLEDENEPISINYTSGTTGLPKGCVYTHRGAYIQSVAQVMEWGMDISSVYLWTLPMFHCDGWCRSWAVACQGSTNVCLTKPDPEIIYDLIEKEGVTHMCGAPILWDRLNQYMEEKGLKFPHNVKIDSGGAPPSTKLTRSMESKGATIVHSYGLTEALGGFTICEVQPEWDNLSAEERAKVKIRQGVANVAAGEVRVVDDSMKEVPYDGKTIGEIVMRGNGLMKEYYKQPKETEEAFAGGWFHTGDGAVVHPDGYLEIKDRFKDIIISGGENISSMEVENVIHEHPDVLEVACFGIKDDMWGEAVKALVKVRESSKTDAEDIINFCRERIAHYKCPKEVEFGEIPRSSTGKILKYILRKQN
ncbi:MAG: acyl--CoA ligase family protein [Dehalococcoidales bacterium]|nr:acyl--CoA ligase family protein [Dehalococcoidales bacterium]